MNAIIPIPKTDVIVRDATSADIPFIDSLQKMHQKMVGFLATKWIEEKIAAGQVLVARASRPRSEDAGETPAPPVGYVIAQDKYLKREELGLIVQLNVAPILQRNLIGATLLKAAFDRAAWGCKLFCCWCAQDIEANRFWESMGFVPLAYRAGSEKKSRVHIFWQKRIREGDVTTPWWYPCQTNAGAMGADRIVLPIPPGKHWSDELPILLPQEREQPRLESVARASRPRSERRKANAGETPAPRKPVSAHGGLYFAPITPPVTEAATKPKREKKPKAKNDPKLVAAARELRDRWLDHVNAGGMLLEGAGKYDVTRALPATSPTPLMALPKSRTPLLPAA